MIRICGAAHYFHRFRDDEPLPDLGERVAAIGHVHFRRIDRFVQLALFGAGECAAGRQLSRECGLYLSSSTGPIGSNLLVQDAIQEAQQLPMPFSFVNTLGTSACYHVAKDLDITGEVVLVARGGGSFTAALACAIADLDSDTVSHALVGAVEECVVPGNRHRAVLQLNNGVAMAEGSHWLLVERGTESGLVIDDAQLDDPVYDGYDSRDAARLTGFTCRHPEMRFGLAGERNSPCTLVQLS